MQHSKYWNGLGKILPLGALGSPHLICGFLNFLIEAGRSQSWKLIWIHQLSSKALHISTGKAVIWFLKDDDSVPVVDDWGGCVGIVHRDDCTLIVPSWMHLFLCLLQPPWSTSLTYSSGRNLRWWWWRAVTCMKAAQDPWVFSPSPYCGVSPATTRRNQMSSTQASPGQPNQNKMSTPTITADSAASLVSFTQLIAIVV